MSEYCSPTLVSLPDAADVFNPCDEEGHALRCERCPPDEKKLRARFRRELPEKARRNVSGFVWLMTVSGPRKPLPCSLTEWLCENHVKDWTYGPLLPGEQDPP